jgi:2-dehydro-3-deoxyphosphogluconate aldolase / (4S)-4-hydroxy-2-oxoglutarate aldolase
MSAVPDAPSIRDHLAALGVVPVIVIDDPGTAVPLGEALVAGGLPCAEITFRTAGAAEALRRMVDGCPDLVVGAGTVLTVAQAAAARAAGARFLVAPGLSASVVEYALGTGIPFFPGVATPTEVEAALALGLDTLKFFPAEPMGGLAFLKAIAGPYVGVSFMPTGGITPQNLAGYLRFAAVVACGGSWMAPRDWVAAGRFDDVRRAAAESVAIARSARAPDGGTA